MYLAKPDSALVTLNESPSEKEGKSCTKIHECSPRDSLNESPSEKEGKFEYLEVSLSQGAPSMKVPPKRKGN